MEYDRQQVTEVSSIKAITALKQSSKPLSMRLQ